MKVAIVGVSGAVGQEFLRVLDERNFPLDELVLFGSKRSAGTIYTFRGKQIEVKLLQHNDDFKGVDIAFTSAGAGTSKEFEKTITKYGAVMIDNSSAFRLCPDVPLVVPEINPEDVKKHKGVIANPNCTTVISCTAVNALNAVSPIESMVVSSYQAVSGAGLGGYNDLRNGINGEPPQKFNHPIFSNCLPQIDVFLPNGYTKEEMKMVNETRKILGDDEMKITATTVRVPVFDCHSEAINVELKKPFDLEELRACLEAAPGLVVQDDIDNCIYPMACTAAGTNETYVGRIRRDESIDNGVNLWVVADNIRKGAATNAVQIAQKFIEMKANGEL
mgnify:CR=1 FL=1